MHNVFKVQGYCSVHGSEIFPGHAECAPRPVQFKTYCSVHGSAYVVGHAECDEIITAGLFDYAKAANRAPVIVAVTGTAIAGGATEDEIKDGSETIIFTLTNATWVASGAVFNATRQAFLNGLTSLGGDWATVVAEMAVTNVVRSTNTVVTITLPAASSYAIEAAELIKIRIPVEAIAFFTQVSAVPPVTGAKIGVGGFTITPSEE